MQIQEQRRQALLQDLRLQDDSTAHGRQAIAANLEETAALNAKLVDLGMHARVELEEAMGTLRQGRKANLAYNGVR